MPHRTVPAAAPGVRPSARRAGYNDGCFGVDEFALNDLTAAFRVEFSFSANLSVKAFVSDSWMMDNDIRDAVEDDSSYAFGAGVSYSF
jgi:hypothetical protein